MNAETISLDFINLTLVGLRACEQLQALGCRVRELRIQGRPSRRPVVWIDPPSAEAGLVGVAMRSDPRETIHAARLGEAQVQWRIGRRRPSAYGDSGGRP